MAEHEGAWVAGEAGQRAASAADVWKGTGASGLVYAYMASFSCIHWGSSSSIDM